MSVAMLELLEKSALQAAALPESDPRLATVAVVGLGYVGLPLAVEFGKHRPTVGYDLSRKKIENIQRRVDTTGELSAAELEGARFLRATQDPAALEHAEFVIVAVPTPINAARQPDLGPLESASVTVGRHLKAGATVIYESTVYPGATEEVCVPILEKQSGMRWRQDFHVGYSPERINPGDREHSFARIVKVVSGDDPETLEKVADLYSSVVSAGVHRVSSIRVAEAAKVIENTQRDLNIAFVNELAIIFDKLGLDTAEVLSAAGTKWNFMPFRPGLVGGHCIGVDPYYLTHKAELPRYPQLEGRRHHSRVARIRGRNLCARSRRRRRRSSAPVRSPAPLVGRPAGRRRPDSGGRPPRVPRSAGISLPAKDRTPRLPHRRQVGVRPGAVPQGRPAGVAAVTAAGRDVSPRRARY